MSDAVTVLNKYHHKNSVPPGAISIMRGTVYGNPFVIGVHGTRDEVIEKYRIWAWDKIKTDPVFRRQVAELYEQDICCCCVPAPCHGVFLEKAAIWLHENPQFFVMPRTALSTTT